MGGRELGWRGVVGRVVYLVVVVVGRGGGSWQLADGEVMVIYNNGLKTCSLSLINELLTFTADLFSSLALCESSNENVLTCYLERSHPRESRFLQTIIQPYSLPINPNKNHPNPSRQLLPSLSPSPQPPSQSTSYQRTEANKTKASLTYVVYY